MHNVQIVSYRFKNFTQPRALGCRGKAKLGVILELFGHAEFSRYAGVDTNIWFKVD